MNRESLGSRDLKDCKADLDWMECEVQRETMGNLGHLVMTVGREGQDP